MQEVDFSNLSDEECERVLDLLVRNSYGIKKGV